MAELRTLLDEAGYDDVRTHLQSGNVRLSSPLAARKLEAALEQTLARALGLEILVLVRTRAELAKVVAHDPLGSVATNGSRYLVTFLSERLPARVARELELAELAPERIAVHGREIYAWHPNGLQRSRAAKLVADAAAGRVSTARNWNTVTKLLELLEH